MASDFASKSEMQSEATEAIIENPRLPAMGEKTTPVRLPRGAQVMDTRPKPDKGGKNRMPEARQGQAKAVKSRARKSADAFPEQIEGKGPGDTSATRQSRGQGKATATASRRGRSGDSYLRMRMRVADGQMSVLDVREVEGPLVMPDQLPSGFAYEVTLGQKRVAVGTVPDLGEWRSYPSPSGPPELQVHHVTRLREAEFNVRVPRAEMSLSALPQTEISLYRVKEPAENRPIPSDQSLEAAFVNEVREVARLKGIKIDMLPKDIQKEVRRVLK